MDKGKELLLKYLPTNAVDEVLDIIYKHKALSLKITRARKTKLGDYRRLNKFQHQITVNHDLNKYQFLLTLLHEISHFLAYKNYGIKIRPHGDEWKHEFRQLLHVFVTPDIFPKEIVPDLLRYAKNPSASTAGDGNLYIKLSKYDTHRNPNKKFIFELEKGTVFALSNGKIFQLQEKRRTRYKCIELQTKKNYLIHQNAEVYVSSKNNIT